MSKIEMESVHHFWAEDADQSIAAMIPRGLHTSDGPG